MPPLCLPQHRLDWIENNDVDNTSVCAGSTCCPTSVITAKTSILWPKNTSTYPQPPLRVRSNTPPEHPPEERDYEIDSGDNTTVIIGSVIGVLFAVIVLALVCCCFMASRRKDRKKDKKAECCSDRRDNSKKKSKEKSKDKSKGKNKKPDKDMPPYIGFPVGSYEQVRDWIAHHPWDYGMGAPQAPPYAYGGYGGYGRQPANEWEAPQMGRGGGWALSNAEKCR